MSENVPGAGDSRWGDFVRVTGVAGAYFLLTHLALEPPVIEGELGKIVWPASGLALAALLLWGVRIWPGVALGAFLSTQHSGGPLVHSVATALGNTIEVVSAAYLMRRVAGFDDRMGRLRDVVALVLCAGAVGATLSATFGSAGLYLGGLAPATALVRIWWKWSLGHAMGMLVVTPFVLAAAHGWNDRLRSKPAVEGGVLLLALVVVGRFAFWSSEGASEYSLEYLPFPLLVWAAFRFGPRGAATANLVTSSMAVWATAAGSGPFSSGSSGVDLLLTWTFVNVSAVTTLLLGAVVAQGRRAERERIRSEARYRMLIEQAADGIFLANDDGKCTDVNTRGCDMLGHERDAVLDMSLPDLVSTEDREAVEALVRELKPGDAVTSSWRMRRADDSSFPAEVSAKRFDDGRLQAFVRDVTERKALEQQLHQSQKMEAVGLLAGGIAHDFNNLLTAIIGHTDFARDKLAADHVVRGDIEEVSKAAARAGDLTRKLLAFARKQIVEPKVVLFDALVFNLENMLRRVLGENIELVTVSSGESWAVKVDPVQLEQVILNIAINARDAMPRGGRLTLECATVYWSGSHEKLDVEMPAGSYATLTASDTGVGMDAETLGRVFEPFYTTKDRSQGTGLGLAVSYGIVKQAGGYIWASSRAGGGSTFRIFLPRAEEPLSAEEVRAETAQVRPQVGGETILLIEDEPLVRELALEVLHARSYNVLTASDGEEALAIARDHPSEIHLTVTDVVLPAMSGKEVAERLKASRPGLKVLFMSGYAEEQVVHHGIVDEDVAFLAKPFTPADLTEKVRSVLDETRVRTYPG